MTSALRVGVVGTTGFIGRSICHQLEQSGHTVIPLRAPRLRSATPSVAGLVRDVRPEVVTRVADQLVGCAVLVNAAGAASALSTDLPGLLGANSLLPGVLQEAARRAGLARFVHVSSAGVQGRRNPLDESSTHDGSSPYTISKALGEDLLDELWWDATVVLRPTSVHGPGRAVTMSVARVARSPLAVVAAPGEDPTPQVHVRQVARSAEILTDLTLAPPRIVLQPWEGFTTSSFLTLLGGRRPLRLPRRLVRSAVRGAFLTSHLGGGRIWAQARRLEMLTLGQSQVPGWLDTVDPSLTRRHPAWQHLA
ncbi:NAD(P)-dependent oxidoreductase [Pedococcus bigeumensis]|uniref:NAD-dependent epimerase/dehydratase family protein n=1 Tax=Pedococcus bigeumensis TaxID=433644 RepID=UPI002FEDDB93